MTNSTTAGIASRISAAVVDAGLSSDDLATKLDLDHDGIEQRLNGTHPWGATEVAQAAAALGCRVDYLLLGITKVAS